MNTYVIEVTKTQALPKRGATIPVHDEAGKAMVLIVDDILDIQTEADGLRVVKLSGTRKEGKR